MTDPMIEPTGEQFEDVAELTDALMDEALDRAPMNGWCTPAQCSLPSLSLPPETAIS